MVAKDAGHNNTKLKFPSQKDHSPTHPIKNEFHISHRADDQGLDFMSHFPGNSVDAFAMVTNLHQKKIALTTHHDDDSPAFSSSTPMEILVYKVFDVTTSVIAGLLCSAWSVINQYQSLFCLDQVISDAHLLQHKLRLTTRCTSLSKGLFLILLLWILNMANLVDGQLVKTFTGHSSGVTNVQVVGNYLFTASVDLSAKAWTINNGSNFNTFASPGGCVPYGLSATTTTIILGCSTGSISSWFWANATASSTYTGHTNAARDIRTIASAAWFFSGSTDYSIRQWNFNSTTALWTITTVDPIFAILVSFDGAFIFGGGGGSFVIQQWAIANRSSVASYPGNGNQITQLDYRVGLLVSASYSSAFTVYYTNFTYWSQSTGLSACYGVQLSTDGIYLFASGYYPTQLLVMHVPSKSFVQFYSGHSGYIGFLSLQSNYIFSPSNDNTVKQWSAPVPNQLSQTLPSDTASIRVLLVAGSYIFSATYNGYIRIWSSVNQANVAWIGPYTYGSTTSMNGIRSLAVDSSINYLYAAGYIESILAISVQNTTVLGAMIGHQNLVYTVVWANRYVFSCSIEQNGIFKQWFASNYSLVVTWYQQGIASGLTATVAADYLYIANSYLTKVIWKWSTANGSQVYNYYGHTDNVNVLLLTATSLFSIAGDQTIRQWATTNSSCFMVFAPGFPISLSLTVDSLVNYVFAGAVSFPYAISQSFVSNGSLVAVFFGHMGTIFALASYGSWIFSASDDQTIKEWNILAAITPAATTITNGMLLQTYTNASSYKTYGLVQLGMYIFSVHSDNAIRRWAISNASFVSACSSCCVAGNSLNIVATTSSLFTAIVANNIGQYWAGNISLMKTFYGHAAPINSLALFGQSDTTAYLVSGGQDTARLWLVNASQVWTYGVAVSVLAVATSFDSFFITVFGGNESFNTNVYQFGVQNQTTLFTYPVYSGSTFGMRTYGNYLLTTSLNATMAVLWWIGNTSRLAILVPTPYQYLYAADLNWNYAFVSGDSPYTISQYSVSNYTLLAVYTGHINVVWSVLAVGAHIFSAALEGNLRQWLITTAGQYPVSYTGHTQQVNRVVAFGNYAVSVSGDGTFREWQLLTLAPNMATLGPYSAGPQTASASLNALCLDATNSFIFVSGYVQSIYVYAFGNMSSGSIASLSGHTSYVWNLVSFDIFVFSASADNTFRRWSITNYTQLNSWTFSGMAFGIATALAGDAIYVSGSSSTASFPIWKWSLTSLSTVLTYTGHTGTVNEIRVSGAFMFSLGADRMIYQWSTINTSYINFFVDPYIFYAMAVDSQTQNLYAGYQSGTFRIVQWAIANTTLVGMYIGHAGVVLHLMLNGPYLYSSSADFKFIRWNAIGSVVPSPAAAPPSGYLYATSPLATAGLLGVATTCGFVFTVGNDGYLRQWSVSNMSNIYYCPNCCFGSSNFALAVSPESVYISQSNFNIAQFLISNISSTPFFTYAGNTFIAFGLSVSGPYLVSGCPDSSLRVFNVNGSLSYKYNGPANGIWSVSTLSSSLFASYYGGSASSNLTKIIQVSLVNQSLVSTYVTYCGVSYQLSVQGNYLLAPVENGAMALLYWTTNSTLLQTFLTDASLMYGVLLTPNFIFAGGTSSIGPSTFLQWSLSNFSLIAGYSGHTNGVRSLAFLTPFVYSASADGTVKQWLCVNATLLAGSSLGHTNIINEVVAQDQYIYTAAKDGTVKQWNSNSGTFVSSINYFGEVTALCATSNFVFAAGVSPYYIMQYFTANLSFALMYNGHSNTVQSLTTQNGFLFSGASDSTFRQWVISNATMLWIENFGSPVFAILSVISNLYVGGSSNAPVTYWISNTSYMFSFNGHTGSIWCLASQGAFLFSGSQDGFSKQWLVANASLIANFALGSPVTSLALSANYVFTGQTVSPYFAYQWFMNNQSISQLYQGHTGSVNGVAISNTFLFSGSSDASLNKWNALSVTTTTTVTQTTSTTTTTAIVTPTPFPALLVQSYARTNPQSAVQAAGPFVFTGSTDSTTAQYIANNGSLACSYTYPSAVSALTSTPDGGLLFISGGSPFFIYVYAAVNYSTVLLYTFTGHKGIVNSMIYQGVSILSSDSTGLLKKWSSTNFTLQWTIITTAAIISAIASTDDGSAVFVAGSCNCILKYWVANSSSVFSISLAYIANGLYANNGLLFSTGQSVIIVWSAVNNSQLLSMSTPSATNMDVLTDPAGTFVYTAGSTPFNIYQYYVVNGTQFAFYTGHSDTVWALALQTPYIYSASNDGSLKQWIYITQGPSTVLKLNTASVNVITSYSFYVISGSTDFSVKIWSSSNGSLSGTLTYPSSVLAVVVSNYGDSIFAAGNSPFSIIQWGFVNQTLMNTFPGNAQAVKALVTFGNSLYSGTSTGIIRRWLTNSTTAIWILTNPSGLTSMISLTLNLDGSWIFIAGSSANILQYRTWDGSSVATIGNGLTVTSPALFRNGYVFYAAQSLPNGRLLMYTTGNSSYIWSVSTLLTSISAIALDSTMSNLYFGGASPFFVFQLYVGNQTLYNLLQGHTASIRYMTVLGSLLYTASDDSTIMQWPIMNVPFAQSYVGHGSTVWAVSFYGGYMYSGSSDYTVRQWSVANGSFMVAFGFPLQVQAIALSGDGNSIFGSGGSPFNIYQFSTVNRSLLNTLYFHIVSVTIMVQNGIYFFSGDAAGNLLYWGPLNSTNPLWGTSSVNFAQITSMVFGWDLVPMFYASGTTNSGGQAVQWAFQNFSVVRVFTSSDFGIARISYQIQYLFTGSQSTSTSASSVISMYSVANSSLVRLMSSPISSILALYADPQLIFFYYGGIGASYVVQHCVSNFSYANTYTGHSGSLTSFSIQGGYLFSGSTDKSVRQWQIANVSAITTSTTTSTTTTSTTTTVTSSFTPVAGYQVRGYSGQSHQVWAAHASGSNLFSASYDGSLLKFSTINGSSLLTYNYGVPLQAMALSPAGDIVFSGGNSPFYIYASPTSSNLTRLATLAGHLNVLRYFITQGNSLFSTDNNGVLKQWLISNFSSIWSVTTAVGNGLSIAISFDSANVFLGGTCNCVQKYGVGNNTVAASFPGAATVNGVYFSNGYLFFGSQGPASGYSFAPIFIYNATNGSLISRTITTASWVTAIASDPMLIYVYAGCYSPNVISQYLFSNMSLVVVFSGHTGVIRSLDFSAPYLYSGSADYTVKQWVFSAQSSSQSFMGHTGAITIVSISGIYMYSGSMDATVKQWTPSNGSLVWNFVYSSAVQAMSPSSSGTSIYVGGLSPFVIWQWSTSNKTILNYYIGHGVSIRSIVTYDPFIYSGDSWGNIRLWSSLNATILWYPNSANNGGLSAVSTLAIGDDFTTVFASGSSPNWSVYQWNVVNNTLINAYGNVQCSTAGVLYQGGFVFFGSIPGSMSQSLVSMYSTTNYSQVWSIASQAGYSLTLKADPTLTLLYFGGAYPNTAYQLYIANQTYYSVFQGHLNYINSLALQGSFLYTGSNDFSILQWPVPNFPIVQSYSGHNGSITSVVSSGSFFYSGSTDQTVKQWVLSSSGGSYTVSYDFTLSIQIQALAVSDTGDSIFAGGTSNFAIYQFATGNKSAMFTFSGHSSAICALIVSSIVLYSGDASGSIIRWGVLNGTAISSSLAALTYITAFSLSLDRAYLFASGSGASSSGAIVQVALSSFTVVQTISAGSVKNATGIVFRLGYLFYGSASQSCCGVLSMVSAGNYSNIWTISTTLESVSSLALDLQMIYVYAAGSNPYYVLQWFVNNQSYVNAFAGHSNSILSLNLQGGSLFSGSADQTIKQWQVVNVPSITTTSTTSTSSFSTTTTKSTTTSTSTTITSAITTTAPIISTTTTTTSTVVPSPTLVLNVIPMSGVSTPISQSVTFVDNSVSSFLQIVKLAYQLSSSGSQLNTMDLSTTYGQSVIRGSGQVTMTGWFTLSYTLTNAMLSVNSSGSISFSTTQCDSCTSGELKIYIDLTSGVQAITQTFTTSPNFSLLNYSFAPISGALSRSYAYSVAVGNSAVVQLIYYPGTLSMVNGTSVSFTILLDPLTSLSYVRFNATPINLSNGNTLAVSNQVTCDVSVDIVVANLTMVSFNGVTGLTLPMFGGAMIFHQGTVLSNLNSIFGSFGYGGDGSLIVQNLLADTSSQINFYPDSSAFGFAADLASFNGNSFLLFPTSVIAGSLPAIHVVNMMLLSSSSGSFNGSLSFDGFSVPFVFNIPNLTGGLIFGCKLNNPSFAVSNVDYLLISSSALVAGAFSQIWVANYASLMLLSQSYQIASSASSSVSVPQSSFDSILVYKIALGKTCQVFQVAYKSGLITPTSQALAFSINYFPSNNSLYAGFTLKGGLNAMNNSLVLSNQLPLNAYGNVVNTINFTVTYLNTVSGQSSLLGGANIVIQPGLLTTILTSANPVAVTAMGNLAVSPSGTVAPYSFIAGVKCFVITVAKATTTTTLLTSILGSSDNGGLSTVAIAGIAGGGGAVVLGGMAAIIYAVRKRPNARPSRTERAPTRLSDWT